MIEDFVVQIYLKVIFNIIIHMYVTKFSCFVVKTILTFGNIIFIQGTNPFQLKNTQL